MLSTRTIILALALSSTTLSAQQAPLVGTWRITYAGEMRVRNGVADPVMVNATLTVQPQGDSLIASLVTDSSSTLPNRPPLRLATKAGGGDAIFLSNSKATLNMNGDERQVTVLNTWTLSVKGDSLSGTLGRQLEGMGDRGPPPSPVSGTRKRS